MKGLLKNNIGKWLYSSEFGKKWVSEKLSRITPFLREGDKIVDIGCGNARLAYGLKQNGFDICLLDIANLSDFSDFTPIVYNGNQMPFEDKKFDKALLITVLHHTENPLEVLKEAKRIAKEIIMIEDIYRNLFQQYLTYFMDTLVNFGFSNMTYQNRNDAEWKHIFSALSLKIQAENEKVVLFFFRQKTYFLTEL
jgi:ubiquinone/menaquinone biosynthesis C-methylase UbiE